MATEPNRGESRIAGLLRTAQRCGIAHNNGAGGQYLLCATEQQLAEFGDELLRPAERAVGRIQINAWGATYSVEGALVGALDFAKNALVAAGDKHTAELIETVVQSVKPKVIDDLRGYTPVLTRAQAERIAASIDESDGGHDGIVEFIWRLAGLAVPVYPEGKPPAGDSEMRLRDGSLVELTAAWLRPT